MNWSRVIESLLNPVGLIWAAHCFLAVRFVWRRAWKKAVFCGGAAALLFFVGATNLSMLLLGRMERPYREMDWENAARAEGIVLLGGALTPSPGDIFSYSLSQSSDRILTALELLRRGKGDFLIVGGGKSLLSPMTNEGDFLKKVTEALGATNRFYFLDHSRNTYDEAMQVRALCQTNGWTNLLLVSSAYHLPRAAALFRHQGIAVTPAGCDYYGDDVFGLADPGNFVPQAGPLGIFQLYVHEQIGWVYYRWRGWLE